MQFFFNPATTLPLHGTLTPTHLLHIAPLSDIFTNFKPCHFITILTPLYPPIICRAKTRTTSFFTCRVARPLGLPHFPSTASYLLPPLYLPPRARSRSQSHPQSRPRPAQADSDYWRTHVPCSAKTDHTDRLPPRARAGRVMSPSGSTTLHQPSSLYGNGLGDGSQPGSGRLGPKDVLVTPQWR